MPSVARVPRWIAGPPWSAGPYTGAAEAHLRRPGRPLTPSQRVQDGTDVAPWSLLPARGRARRGGLHRVAGHAGRAADRRRARRCRADRERVAHAAAAHEDRAPDGDA